MCACVCVFFARVFVCVFVCVYVRACGQCEGLRIVRPYMFVFATSAKERWFGRSIVDVFTQEFRVRSKENLLLNIEAGNMSC